MASTPDLRRPVRGVRARRGDGGFTLVELLVVIVVLGILSGIAVFGVARSRTDASAAACQADVAGVNAAADAYLAVTGNYPATTTDLTVGQYLKRAPASGTFTFDATARTATRSPGCGTVDSGVTTPTATPTTTATPTGTVAPVAGACTARVAIDNFWPQGFQASITVTNTGSSPVSPWTVTWHLRGSATVTNGWNATVNQSGQRVTAGAPDWSRTIAPGAAWTIGFIADGPSSPPPFRVTLNGVSCAA